PPLLERLLDAEGVAEIDRPREALFRAVVAMRGQQLLGPQHAERVEQLRPDLVLPAGSARRRCQHDPQAVSVTLLRQQRVVLIVRMGGDVHHGAGDRELAEQELETDESRIRDAVESGRSGDEEREQRDEREEERTTGHHCQSTCERPLQRPASLVKPKYSSDRSGAPWTARTSRRAAWKEAARFAPSPSAKRCRG